MAKQSKPVQQPSLVQQARQRSIATNLRERKAINQSSARDYQAWAARREQRS